MIVNLANSENPDETAHKEPSHLDFHCLQTYVRIYLMSEVTRLYPTVNKGMSCCYAKGLHESHTGLKKTLSPPPPPNPPKPFMV